MLFALPFPAFAEAAFACATATQLVAASSIPALPAFFRMLRPVRAGHWKWLLLHVWVAGAEPRHTRQGCRHPCVSAASRLAQPFCTRPPDLFGSVLLDVLLLVSLRRRMPQMGNRRQPNRRSGRLSGPPPDDDLDTTDPAAPADAVVPGASVFRISEIGIQDSNLPQVNTPDDIAHLAYELVRQLGNNYSWVITLATSYVKFLSRADRVQCEDARATFLATYNALAPSTLQHYVYQRLDVAFSNFSEVGQVFVNITSGEPDCATQCWEAILRLYPLDSVLMTHLQLARCVSGAVAGPVSSQHSDVQAWFTQMIKLRRQFYADSKFSLDDLMASLMLASLGSSDDPYLRAASVAIKTSIEHAHAEDPDDVTLDFASIKTITVNKVRHRNGPASHTSSAEVLSANVARGRSPGPVRRHACTHCPVHCPARPGAASHPRRSDKSPSVYSASSASPRYLHDDDFDTEATIAALQARVNSLESQQQAQHLTIQSAFFQDPPVDSDQD